MKGAVGFGVNVLHGDLEAVEAASLGPFVLLSKTVGPGSRSQCHRWQLEKASTYLMKCFSLGVSFSQSRWSWDRSTSSAVQNEGEVLLIEGIDGVVLDGKENKRWGLGARMGSSRRGAW